MIRRRCSRRGRGGRPRGAPLPGEGGPARPVGGGLAARIGAPPLIALATAVSLMALLLCAFFVPGFVLRAAAETTVPTAQTRAGATGRHRRLVPNRPLPSRSR